MMCIYSRYKYVIEKSINSTWMCVKDHMNLCTVLKLPKSTHLNLKQVAWLYIKFFMFFAYNAWNEYTMGRSSASIHPSKCFIFITLQAISIKSDVDSLNYISCKSHLTYTCPFNLPLHFMLKSLLPNFSKMIHPRKQNINHIKVYTHHLKHFSRWCIFNKI